MPSKKVVKKRGPKNVSAEQGLYKNMPLGGPQLTLDRFVAAKCRKT